MKIKEFFKPTKGKIIIFFIIIILAHSPYIGYHSKTIPCITKQINCPPHTIYIYNSILWLPYSLTTFHYNPLHQHYALFKKAIDFDRGNYFVSKDFAFFVHVPLMLFYWHFLSCAIILIYNRLTKKYEKTKKK